MTMSESLRRMADMLELGLNTSIDPRKLVRITIDTLRELADSLEPLAKP